MISSPTSFNQQPPQPTSGTLGRGAPPKQAKSQSAWKPTTWAYMGGKPAASNQQQLTMGGWGGAPQNAAPPAQGGVNYSTFGTFEQPQYISDQTTQGVMNNQLAQGDAAADMRGILKSFEQPGRSLGRGEKYRAGVQSANTQQNARFDAAQTAMNNAAQNAKMRTDFEYARDREGQGLGALQNMLAQGNWANQFSMSQNAARQLSQRQQAALQVLGPLFSMFQ